MTSASVLLPALPVGAANIESLDGLWRFAWLGDVDPTTVDWNAPCCERMPVPGCFDTFPDHAGKRGLVRYERDFRLVEPGPCRLWFDGVHHWAQIFVDGRPVGEHSGGFTRFALDAGDLGAGMHTIALLVDNRIDYDRCPLHLDYFDWYHYGGIARGAWLERLEPARIERVDISTEELASRRMRVRLILDRGASSPEATLRIRVDGQIELEERVKPEEYGEHDVIERTFELPGADLWSPANPALHELVVEFGGARRRLRFGIRTIRVDGNRLLLNDEPLHLRGVCRHEINEPYGHTQSMGLLVADLQRIKQLGANFVRGSHYPQDERFLDLCDELGILVWSEATAWQPAVEHLTDPHFLKAHAVVVREMVAAANHHPCVIMWGVFNEGAAHDKSVRPAYAEALNLLRELDPTRPVTAAFHRIEECECLDLVDLVAVNTYPGWYGGEIEEIPTQLESVRQHVINRGGAGKPLLISELGGGAIYGCRDTFGDRWSESYQERLFDVALSHLFANREHFLGIAIWQFADGRTSEYPNPVLARPRGFNNKGLYDEYRRPKLAAATVRRHFGG